MARFATVAARGLRLPLGNGLVAAGWPIRTAPTSASCTSATAGALPAAGAAGSSIATATTVAVVRLLVVLRASCRRVDVLLCLDLECLGRLWFASGGLRVLNAGRHHQGLQRDQ
ncbi:hypothetical protein PF006_g29979 [Phytophthora fragariae]|uniref:Uncharacterized protein n=2 Tax=Phytophthora fragariae TaxID=53985 RepID=A0A6A3Q293_9STRA|nr:hypothetical protein PF009_g29689 [Phytophthora fragariae]KAE9067524.1 hypothetical protein PF006_g29979 [Phytophthora fragariae]KAE9279593.1 hypothetical protein PF008_g28321 [Phytophthora fragariae]